MVNALAERVKAYWASISGTVRPGVTQEAIQTFEARYRVCLPQDMRDYFCAVDGMEEGDCDYDLYFFWSLERIKSVSEELAEYGKTSDLEEPDSYFVFADFLIWSHAYAIRLFPDRSGTNSVIWLCPGCQPPHYVMAESFSEIMERYLANPNDVLFPPDDVMPPGESGA